MKRTRYLHQCLTINAFLFIASVSCALISLSCGANLATDIQTIHSSTVTAHQQKNSLHFGNYNTDDGLSHQTSLDILQDSAGFLWIATFEGLNRFDGHRFKVFEAGADQLTSNYTTALSEDHNRNLWIGTESGVTRLNLTTYQFSKFSLNEFDTTRSVYVYDLHVDTNGVLWAGTNAGLYRYDDSKQQFFHVLKVGDIEGKNLHIGYVKSDTAGNIWLLVENQGIFLIKAKNTNANKLTKNQLTPLQTLYPQLKLPNDIYSIWADKKQQLWLGLRGDINILNLAQGSLTSLNLPTDRTDERHSTEVMSFTQDKQGLVWITTAGKGLYLYSQHNKNLQHFYLSPQFSYDITDLIIWNSTLDNEGRLWFTTTGNGIVYFDPKLSLFNHYYHDSQNPNSIKSNVIWALFEDSQQQKWVGHGKGLDLLDQRYRRIKSFHHGDDDTQNLSDTAVYYIVEDVSGDIWLATDNGLNRYSPKTQKIKHYLHDTTVTNSLPKHRVFYLYINQQKTLWISTSAGIAQYRPDTDDFALIPALNEMTILQIVSGEANIYWMATRNNGLIRFDHSTNKTQRFLHDADNNLASKNIMTLALVGKYLWLGTYDGLIKINIANKETKRYTTKQGLPSNVVYQLEIDKKGDIWGSTTKGLFKLTVNNDLVQRFSPQHGLQSDDFNAGSVHQNSEGMLFFGGPQGFNVFNPAQLTFEQPQKPVHLTELRLLNLPLAPKENTLLPKPLHLMKKLTFNYQQNVFSLAFSNLDHSNPDIITYNYKLENFDQHWLTPLPGNPQATYTNLDAGYYRFLIRLRRGAGPWQQNTLIAIEVQPPPWATWWAYSLYTMAISLILLSLYWQHWQKQQARSQYFENLAQQKKQLDLALWGSGDELWEWDLQQQKITRFNCLHILRSLNNDPQFSLTKLDECIHPDDRVTVLQAIEAHLQGKTPFYEATYRVKSQENQWFWVLDRGKVVKTDQNQQPILFSGTSKDINQLKLVEDKLRQLTEQLESRVAQRTQELQGRSHELQQSNQHLQKTLKTLKVTQNQLIEAEKMAALGTLVIGVSHEINTPLGIAITALSLLQDQSVLLFNDKSGGKLTKKQFNDFETTSNECFNLLQRNLKRVSMLVKNFKGIAVNQSGEEQKKFDLKFTLEYIKAAVREKYGELNYQLTIDSDCTIELTSYEQCLTSVLMQLIKNSFEHASELRLSINISTHIENKNCIVVYQDNGLGVDKAIQKHMFEPFFTTRRNTGNIGLGMHIVFNQVTQKLGGSIDYQEQADSGAMFKINIPLVSPILNHND